MPSGPWSLVVPLVIVGILATGAIPGIVWCYWAFVVPRRLDDIEVSIWSDEALKRYVRLFAKEGTTPGVGLATIVRSEFLGVQSRRQYGLYVAPLTLVVGTILYVIGTWVYSRITENGQVIGKLDGAIVLAMAGAYIWSVYELLGRFRTRDLTPDELLDLLLRQVSAVPIGYAFSLLAVDKLAGTFAFASAAFPLRDLRLLWRRQAIKKLDAGPPGASRTNEGHVATAIDGLSDATVARLEAIGMSTYLDLAYSNPIRVMARTGFSLRHIVAWIDQALLCVYAPAAKSKLAAAGIPCALDAVEFYDEHFAKAPAASADGSPAPEDPAVAAVVEASGLKAPILGEIFARVKRDPHVGFLDAIWNERDAGDSAAESAAEGRP